MRRGAATALFFTLAACSADNEPASDLCASRAVDGIGGAFDLIDHEGRAASENNFAGRDALVYFGFTWCPDVCPAALYKIGRAMEELPPRMRPLTLLISVDPARDTPEMLASYIRSNGFPDDIVGLTGDEAAIAATARAFATGYSRVEDPGGAGDYTMDHTSILYLMDAEWKLKTFFTHDATPDQIAGCIRALS